MCVVVYIAVLERRVCFYHQACDTAGTAGKVIPTRFIVQAHFSHCDGMLASFDLAPLLLRNTPTVGEDVLDGRKQQHGQSQGHAPANSAQCRNGPRQKFQDPARTGKGPAKSL